MRKLIRKGALVAFALVSTACASAESDDGNWESLAHSGGEGVFVEKCGMCHRPNGMGTGLLGRRYEGDLALLESRDDLAGSFVKTVVRRGLGNMQPLSRAEVSDTQLDKIAAYLAGDAE